MERAHAAILGLIASSTTACAEGPGTVEVFLRSEEPVALTLLEVSLRPEDRPWDEDWEPLDLVLDQTQVDSEGVLVAEGELPPDTWVHVFPDVADCARLSDELALADIVEPIAARFRLRSGRARRITVDLLVLEETPDGPGLFAIDTEVGRP